MKIGDLDFMKCLGSEYREEDVVLAWETRRGLMICGRIVRAMLGEVILTTWRSSMSNSLKSSVDTDELIGRTFTIFGTLTKCMLKRVINGGVRAKEQIDLYELLSRWRSEKGLQDDRECLQGHGLYHMKRPYRRCPDSPAVCAARCIF